MSKLTKGTHSMPTGLERIRSGPESDPSMERWLRESVAPVYDAMQANPETAIPADQVFSQIRELRTKPLEG